MPIKLHQIDVSSDVVEVLAVLLENARLGNITGLAFAATLKKSRYIVHVLGRCQAHPTFTRGMIASLDDDLAQMAKGQDPGHSR